MVAIDLIVPPLPDNFTLSAKPIPLALTGLGSVAYHGYIKRCLCVRLSCRCFVRPVGL